MRIRKEIVEDKSLFIIDGVFSKETIERFFKSTLDLPYKRDNKDFKDDKFPIFGYDFNPNKFEEKVLLGITSRKLIKQFFPENELTLKRVFLNMSHYGDVEYPHRDCPKGEHNVTVLYYVNDKWDYRWGGETLFYEQLETRIAVLPIPGRFLIFKGAIEHMGSIPTRICNVSRITLALHYTAK